MEIDNINDIIADAVNSERDARIEAMYYDLIWCHYETLHQYAEASFHA